MKKPNVTDLVKEYKQTKSEKIFNKIYEKLKPFIREKSKYLYVTKFFQIGKRYYSVSDSSYQREDIEQDLMLEILKMIKKYDGIRDFNTYLISSLWKYKPSFVNREFINCLGQDQISEHEESEKVAYEIENNFFAEDILSFCKSENEKKVMFAYLSDTSLSQLEIARKIGVSQQYISLILLGLQKKLKKYLLNL